MVREMEPSVELDSRRCKHLHAHIFICYLCQFHCTGMDLDLAD
jgi:hypothetical protein